MLATLHHEGAFDDEAWIFEKKFDGMRCLVFFDGKNVRLLSRNKKKLNDQYPEIAEQIPKMSGKSFVLDGEIVVDQGKMDSFSKLQKRMQVKDPSSKLKKKYPVTLHVFDILYFDGKKLTDKPLLERKKILKKLSFPSKVAYTRHETESGKAYLKKMSRQGYEGAIAKEKNSRYLSSRSKKWLKLKCHKGQEFVIGGYTDPKGSRTGFGALLLGVYKNGSLHYAGKVGTGFDKKELKDLKQTLGNLKRKTSPFKDGPDDASSIHWVTPKKVAEVGFTEWTDDLKLRHPRYLGLRTDKNPKDVVKE